VAVGAHEDDGAELGWDEDGVDADVDAFRAEAADEGLVV